MKRLVLTILLLVIRPGVVHADENAATWYAQAIRLMDELRDEEWAFLAEDGATLDSPLLRSIVDKGQPVIALACRGAQQPTCDFGEGPRLGSPPPGPDPEQIRSIARLMRADAMLRLIDEDSAGSAKVLAAMYRVGGHLDEITLVRSSVAGIVVFRMADQMVLTGLNDAAFSPSDCQVLADALAAFEGRDPFDLLRARVAEHEMLLRWLDERHRDGLEPSEVARRLGEHAGYMNRALILAAMDAESFRAQLTHYKAVMKLVKKAFAGEDPIEARRLLAEAEEELAAGDDLVAVLDMSFERLYDRQLKMRRLVEERRKMLAEMLGDLEA